MISFGSKTLTAAPKGGGAPCAKRAGLALWLVPAICLGASTPGLAQGKPEGRAARLETLLKSWMSTGNRPADAKAVAAKSDFLWRGLDDPQPFVLPLGRDPEKICDRLDEAGFGNLGWRQTEFGASDWECVLIADALTGDPNSNALFYQLRGRTRFRLSFARLKINVPQDADRARTVTKASEFVAVFARSVGMDAPVAARQAIEALRPGRIFTDSATYTLKQEFGGEQRFNLSIELGRPQRAFIPVSKPGQAPDEAASGIVPETPPSDKKARLGSGP